MNKKTIIGFAGRKRAGKTCLSKYLAETYNGTVITVADALKHLCCELLDFNSVEVLNSYKDNGTSWSFNSEKYAHIWTKTICDKVLVEYTDSEYKEILEQIDGILTYNVRELLQFVGTDIIRKYRPNWHVDKMVEAINSAPTDLVCIDDVRFPNEREAIESLGGNVFFVMRPDLSIGVSNHESEKSLLWTDFSNNRTIINMFDLDYMFEKIAEAYTYGFHLTTSNPIFSHANDNFNNENKYFGYIGKNSPFDLQSNQMQAVEFNFIKHVILVKAKTHNGCIVLHPTNEEQMKFYYKCLYGRMPTRKINTCVVWNPFIIENLKAWIL